MTLKQDVGGSLGLTRVAGVVHGDEAHFLTEQTAVAVKIGYCLLRTGLGQLPGPGYPAGKGKWDTDHDVGRGRRCGEHA
jgi:hypothetical protein